MEKQISFLFIYIIYTVTGKEDGELRGRDTGVHSGGGPSFYSSRSRSGAGMRAFFLVGGGGAAPTRGRPRGRGGGGDRERRHEEAEARRGEYLLKLNEFISYVLL